jgi:hypothetical protein
MTTVVFLLEEPSAKALLEGLLPRILPAHVEVTLLAFEGKQDLEKNIPMKLKAWRKPDTLFVVLRDQDSAPDCTKVKSHLVGLVRKSGKPALVRLACRTLEAWVAGDLDAVAKAFDAPGVAKHKTEKKFRNPDALGSAYDELRRLVPTYQKIDGARRVGLLLDPEANASASFKSLCTGLRQLVAACESDSHA